MGTGSSDDEQLKQAVERRYGVKAVLTYVSRVRIDYPRVWNGLVHVFDLEGHLTATRAYAWSSPIDGNRRFRSELNLDGIRSPVDALRTELGEPSELPFDVGEPLHPAPTPPPA